MFGYFIDKIILKVYFVILVSFLYFVLKENYAGNWPRITSEIMKWYAAQFCVHVKKTCRTSHTALVRVQSGVERLLEDYIDVAIV